MNLRSSAAGALGQLAEVDAQAATITNECLQDEQDAIRKAAVGGLAQRLEDETDRKLLSTDLDALVPWLDTSSVRSGQYRPMFKWWFRLLIVDFVVLMWVGGQTPTVLTGWISLIAATYWFAYFLVVLPLLGVIEKPTAPPVTIEDDFNAHYGANSHPAE